MHRILRIVAIFSVLVVAGCAARADGSVRPDPAVVGASPDRPLKDEEIEGVASWYGDRFHGRSTASGQPFNMHEMTAAHKTFPFGTVVRVVRRDTLQSVVVRVNDRGPYSAGRIIDLSKAAAEELGLIQRGTAEVRLEILHWGDGQTFHR